MAQTTTTTQFTRSNGTLYIAFDLSRTKWQLAMSDGAAKPRDVVVGRESIDVAEVQFIDLTARMAALIPLPGRPTIRHYGAFAPNARLRPLVVKAGDLAPRRRDKPETAAHDCQVALTDAELAHHAVEQARQTSGRLTWSQAMTLAFKADVLQCDCGGRRALVALIDQPPVVKKILAHLGLATEALTKPEETIWRVRGPPEELFPLDLDDAGLAVEFDAVDEEPSEPFFDELPADDWAA